MPPPAGVCGWLIMDWYALKSAHPEIELILHKCWGVW